MTALPPASREEISELLGDVDESYVDRVLDTGASVDEIGEAISDLERDESPESTLPSSARVVQVRAVLEELVGDHVSPSRFPMPGRPIGYPI